MNARTRLRRVLAPFASLILAAAASVPIGLAGSAALSPAVSAQSNSCSGETISISLNGTSVQVALPTASPSTTIELNEPETITINGQSETVYLPGIYVTFSSTCSASLTKTPPAVTQLTLCDPDTSGLTVTDVTADYYPDNSKTLYASQDLGTPTLTAGCFTFTPMNLAPGNYTVVGVWTFKGGSTEDSPNQVFAAPLATAASITASPSAAENVTEDTPTTITFTVKDALGQPVPGEPVSVTTQASASCPAGSNTPSAADLADGAGNTGSATGLQEVSDVNGQVTVTLTDPTVGDCGVVTATAEAVSGVAAMTGTLTVVASQPAKISISPSTATSFNENTAQPITVTVQQANGSAAPEVPVTLSLAGKLGGTFYATDTGGTLSNPVDFAAGPVETNSAGQVVLYYSDPTPGDSGSVTATATAEPGGQQITATTGTLTVTNSGPTGIQLTAGPSGAKNVADGVPVTFTFQVTGESGADLTGLQVNFGVTGNLSAGDLSATSGTTDGNGDVSVTFTPTEMAGNSGTVTATVQGTLFEAQSGTLTVVAGAPAKISLTPTQTRVTVGQMGTATVTLEDAYGNPITATNQAVQLWGTVFTQSPAGAQARFVQGTSTYPFNGTDYGEPSGYDGANATLLDFVNGQATLTYIPAATGTGLTLSVGLPKSRTAGAPLVSTATVTGLSVVSGGTDAPASIHVLAPNTTNQDMTAGTLYPVQFEVEDANGNGVPGVTVMFTLQGTTGISLESTAPVTTDQNGIATAYLTDSNAGDQTMVQAVTLIGGAITTATSGWVTVVPAQVSQIVVSPPGPITIYDYSQEAANLHLPTHQDYTFTTEDAYGNPVSNVPLVISTSPSVADGGLLTNGMTLGGVSNGPTTLSGYTNQSGELTLQYDTGTVGQLKAIQGAGTFTATDLGNGAISATTGLLTVVDLPGQVSVTLPANFPTLSNFESNNYSGPVYEATVDDGFTVTATALDAAGNPLPNEPVTFLVPPTKNCIPSMNGGCGFLQGTFSQNVVTTNLEGIATTTFTPTAETPSYGPFGSEYATPGGIFAIVGISQSQFLKGFPIWSTQYPILVQAGAPASITSNLTGTTTYAAYSDGQPNTMRIWLHVTDANGNPVAPGTPLVCTPTGTLNHGSLEFQFGEIGIPDFTVTTGDDGVAVIEFQSATAEVEGQPVSGTIICQTGNVTYTTPTINVVWNPSQFPTVSASPSGDEYLAPGSVPVTFTVTDDQGNPVPGASGFIWTDGSLSLGSVAGTGDTTVSGPNGFGNLNATTDALGDVNLSYTGSAGQSGDIGFGLTFSSTSPPDFISAETGTLTFLSALPASLVLVPSKSDLSVAATGTGQATFEVEDANGNPVSGVTVAASRSDPNFALGTTSQVSDANGDVTFDFTTGDLADTATLTATVVQSDGSTPVSPAITATANLSSVLMASAFASSCTRSPSPVDIPVNGTQTVTCQVMDTANGGNVPVSGVTVNATLTPTDNVATNSISVVGSSTGTTDASGDVTFTLTGTTAGDTANLILNVAAGAASGAFSSAPIPVSVYDPATQVVFLGSSPVTIPTGTTQTLQFEVEDANGNGVPGVGIGVNLKDTSGSSVTFVSQSPSGYGATSGAGGLVSVQVTGTNPGDMATVTAAITGPSYEPGLGQSASATVGVVDVPGYIGCQSSAQTTQSDADEIVTGDTLQLVCQVFGKVSHQALPNYTIDASLTPIAPTNGNTITFTNGTSTASGSTGGTGGGATFDLTGTNVNDQATVTFTIQGNSTIQSTTSFEVVPAGAAQLQLVSPSPVNITPNGPSQVQFEVEDASGNPVSGASVSATIVNDSGTNTLSVQKTPQTSDANGMVYFTVSGTTVGETGQLQATISGLGTPQATATADLSVVAQPNAITDCMASPSPVDSATGAYVVGWDGAVQYTCTVVSGNTNVPEPGVTILGTLTALTPTMDTLTLVSRKQVTNAQGQVTFIVQQPALGGPYQESDLVLSVAGLPGGPTQSQNFESAMPSLTLVSAHWKDLTSNSALGAKGTLDLPVGEAVDVTYQANYLGPTDNVLGPAPVSLTASSGFTNLTGIPSTPQSSPTGQVTFVLTDGTVGDGGSGAFLQASSGSLMLNTPTIVSGTLALTLSANSPMGVTLSGPDLGNAYTVSYPTPPPFQKETLIFAVSLVDAQGQTISVGADASDAVSVTGGPPSVPSGVALSGGQFTLSFTVSAGPVPPVATVSDSKNPSVTSATLEFNPKP